MSLSLGASGSGGTRRWRAVRAILCATTVQASDGPALSLSPPCRVVQSVGVVERIPRTIGAKDEAHDAVRAAKQAAVENPLPEMFGVAAFETKHWERKRDLGWIAQVGTSDRFVGVGFE